MIPLDPIEHSGADSAGGAETGSMGRRPPVSGSGVPFSPHQPLGAVAPFAGRTGGPGPRAATMHMRAAGEEIR